MATYTIADKKYTIKPLVLGQVKQLSDLMEDIELSQNFTIFDVVSKLGKKLPRFLSIILVEEGKKLSEKNIDELEQIIEENVDVDTGFKMVEDFFEITPIQSLLARVVEGMNKVLSKAQ